MERIYDVVKPNLYSAGNAVYFSVSPSDVVGVCRTIDEVVKEHIGDLMVSKTDLDVINGSRGNVSENEEWVVPLETYLGRLKRDFSLGEELNGITNDPDRLFGLSYKVYASTVKKFGDIKWWKGLRRDLADPDKLFDNYENQNLIFRVDRERTLEEMKKLYEKLDQDVPNNYATLFVLSGKAPYSREEFQSKSVGRVSFGQVKAEDDTGIKEAKSDLIGKLKEVDGPCLSFDTPDLINQSIGLSNVADNLINNYGDILMDPNWSRRFFRLDP
ncbi:MAG: hypothetical protein IH845_02150 [Nanoarchaeota archaeon]|nr:hypothetical protein [Nanoarchaeota archaeon]